MKRQLILCLGALFVLLSCAKNKAVIANALDYEELLNQHPKVPQWVQQDLEFWANKTLEHPEQFPYKAKLAVAYGAIFAITQDILDLNYSNLLWEDVNQVTGNREAGYLRSAAKQAITAHEFKKAYALLTTAETHGGQLKSTRKMLFDVCMELGLYQKAQQYLNFITDLKDVDYLIRRSKWEDYQGNLTAAISNLEQVMEYAYTNKNKALQQWSLTNLGDYYGHQGNIAKAYTSYLRALGLDPANKYAKKGIAYIAFAHDKNPTEALRIMEAITVVNRTPDDLLFMAELYDFAGDNSAKNKCLTAFKLLLKDKEFGELYNIPLALVLAQEDANYTAALELLNHEVTRRATPETYGALAYVYMLSGAKYKALTIAKEHVIGKSEEPVLLLYTAAILKANGLANDIPAIKKELLEAKFELGPLATQEVLSL